MIECLETAEQNLTPQMCFLNNERRRVRGQDFSSVDRPGAAEIDSNARVRWNDMVEQERVVWELRSRSMIARQPFIADSIIYALREDPTLSWVQVASSIDDWCSPSTIQRWFHSYKGRGGYCTYTERLLPLLSEQQRRKHVIFSNHLLNHWGKDPNGKYLWIHYDEKWFWGFVARHAKVCEALGLSRQERFAYHKNHINKVMGTAVVGFAFEGSPNNGGVGVKIAFTRALASKIAEKSQRAYSGKNPTTGAAQYRGPLLREKGDAYSVDCCVTGSNEGTSDDPKFSLVRFFRLLVFLRILDLVKVGGDFEGYIPDIQGDQAGPHEEEEFKRFVKQWCLEHGWLWEPQAPQMPHMNTLDLAVFPSMSKRHSGLTRSHTGSVASKDVI